MYKALLAWPRAPREYDRTQPAGGPGWGEHVYARRRRHSRAHLYAERSPRYDSWPGTKPDGLVTSLRSHILHRPGRYDVLRPTGGRLGRARVGLGPARTGLPTREKERKENCRKGRRCPTEGGAGIRLTSARLKIVRAKRRGAPSTARSGKRSNR